MKEMSDQVVNDCLNIGAVNYVGLLDLSQKYGYVRGYLQCKYIVV